MTGSDYILNVELIRFPDGLDMRCKKKSEELQMSQDLDPSNWNGAIGRMGLGTRTQVQFQNKLRLQLGIK